MDPNLIEVSVDSIRVSLISPHRIVVLKDKEERYLPIWIGPFEADAIHLALQGTQPARPLTHDLLKAMIHEAGGEASHIVVTDLSEDTFYARIVMELNGRHVELDSRPSDAIALAVRLGVPVLVARDVMDKASIRPSQSVENIKSEEEEKLGAFRDLLEDLDLDDLGKGDTRREE